ncbi:DUF1553 domain-containing protein [Maioricimonas sp. JC845]|uniref:DUF1553 domain-containing protein n=1 Tax=Maioricimonas sp. JC845 TaxID=3232138 RepID=UPI0034598890
MISQPAALIRTGAPVLALLLLPSLARAAQREEIDFNRDVAPILVSRCLECHHQTEAAGGLVLSNADGLARGGDSGAAITPGNVDESLLHQRIADGEMPPERKGQPQPLPPEEARILARWIRAGAPWPAGRVLDPYERTSDVRGGRDWWSLQPITRPPVPQVRQQQRIANPIDAFILARLEAEEMQPAPVADRRTLIRRLFIDLTGLPPTAEQIAASEQDDAPDAWERLVDRLLASPHFGERWARHWLDVVRFAETSGYERDQTKPFAWKYRDWVVQAFNEDLPYDRFILEQLAGDELPDRTEQSVIGTGFLRLGTWNDEPNDPQDYKYERLEDLVHATSSAFLGMTVKCARCHDHKFDPIPQLDYYRMAAAFWPGPIEPRSRKLLGGPSADELGMTDVLGWTDVTTSPAPLHLLRNGERHHPLQQVAPASLSLIPELFREFEAPQSESRTTQRRLQLARWIARPDNPLTARVIVNRLWQHHFGKGLVRSPNNFGFTGEQPTHPELLDWLASELIANGWRLKPLHRLMVTSTTYRQTSVHPDWSDYSESDFANRRWWRAERRRVDAETLRDSLLASSGELDLKLGGPSFRPSVSPEALEGLSRKASAWDASPETEQHRRSLYIFMQRSLLPPIMTTFDLPDTTLPCGRRDATTVAPQALSLLNNDFIHRRSLALARHAIDTAETPAERAAHVWQSVYGRAPQSDELAAAIGHVTRQQERFADPPETKSTEPSWRTAGVSPVTDGLVLALDAGSGTILDDDGRLTGWQDASGHGHHASQPEADHRPVLVGDAISGQPAIRFDGQRRFVTLDGSLLTDDACTIFAVVTDTGPAGHREIISNWSGRDGNSVSSLFLGLTGTDSVRFSDNFAPAGTIDRSQGPLLLTAVNSSDGAAVWQNGTELGRRSQPLAPRRLDTPWVIGQQGNIDGEYWTGDIAAIRVYDRALTDDERHRVWNELIDRYQLPAEIAETEKREPHDPELLAWASLCVVLFNSNEFLYID